MFKWGAGIVNLFVFIVSAFFSVNTLAVASYTGMTSKIITPCKIEDEGVMHHYPSLEEMREEAANLIPSGKRIRTEKGRALYRKADGSIGISDEIPGNAEQLDTRVLNRTLTRYPNGTIMIKGGCLGVEEDSELIEIVHNHPRGKGFHLSGSDVITSEGLEINITVIRSGKSQTWTPQGIDTHKIDPIRGRFKGQVVSSY